MPSCPLFTPQTTVSAAAALHFNSLRVRLGGGMKDGGSFERAEAARTCGRALTEPCKRMHFWVLSFAGSWSHHRRRHRHTPHELGWG